MAKILLIDSDRANRQILEHALMLYEHDVVTNSRSEDGPTLASSEDMARIDRGREATGLNGWRGRKKIKE